MSRTVRPTVLSGDAARIAERQDITTSSEFMQFIQQRKTEAERRRADLLTEVERLETEINARYILIGHEDEIMSRAEAALTLDVPVTRTQPLLTPHGEVKEALEEQK